MRFFDAFSGYGGFHLGIERAYGLRNQQSTEVKQDREGRHRNADKGGDDVLFTGRAAPLCVGYSEIDKYASAVYKYHFGGTNYGDITKIDPTTIPDFDLFCGGFPCQAFSIAGKRLGFAETRGTLIYDVFRILKEKQPRFVILENVKGLLSHDGGNTFKVIITSFAELGYDVEWQVLNAKNFGVPQNRERVFVIGHLGGFGGRQIFPIGQNDQLHHGESQAKEGQPQAKIAGTVRRVSGKADDTFIKETHRLSDAMRVRSTDGNAVTLKGLGGGLGAKTGLYAVPVLTPDRIEKRQNGRRFKEDGEPMFTLNTQDKHGIYDGMKIRRLTPLECERLMGLPDYWTAIGSFYDDHMCLNNAVAISDTQRYKLCGNGVVVNVVEEIIKRLLKPTEGEDR